MSHLPFQAIENYTNIRPMVVSRLASDVSAVTGDATEYTLLCNEIVDLENNYNPSTGIITIPSDGIYSVSSIIRINGVNIGESNSRIIMKFVTGSASIVFYDSDDSSAPPSGNFTANGSILLNLSQSDTIKTTVLVQGSATKNVGVLAGSYFTLKLEANT